MGSDYRKIADENIRKYGTDVGRYGRVLLANLYSERTHFVYELLQNAEDAGATRVTFRLTRDRLEVSHDGRPFNEDDVIGICGLVEAKKDKDLTQIGKFGIGFKSVHAYTRSPEVHSREEHFRITDYVRPTSAAPRALADWETLFVFPFDLADVGPEKSFSQIAARLRNLGPRTLLFLRNTQQILWAIDGVPEGSYERAEKPAGRARRVSVITNRQVDDEREEWLVFDRPAAPEVDERLRVEIALLLNRDEDRTHEEILAVQNATLAAFFPTEKETHLGFLIQGPYRTTPARDNIPKDDPEDWNRRVIRETGTLVAEALPQMRDMGLLSVECLETLPLERSDFDEDDMFLPIFEAVRQAFMNAALLPTDGGTFARADEGVLGRGEALRQLLPGVKLRELCKTNKKLEWLTGEITEVSTPSLHWYLRHELGIEELTPDAFASRLDRGFIEKQPDKWMVLFYRFLAGQQALWRMTAAGPLLSKPFVRLADNKHVPPFGEDGSPAAYLPTFDDTGFPTVKRAIAADAEALAFLKALGLPEPDVVAQVLDRLLARYDDRERAHRISTAKRSRDLKLIFRALRAESDRREELVERLRTTPFLWSRNAGTGSEALMCPSQLYVPSPELEMYFEGNGQAWFLHDELADSEQKLEELGVSSEVRVHRRESDWRGHVVIRDDRGYHMRGVDGFDPGFKIDGLEHAVSRGGKERAKYIWNKLLLPNHGSLQGTVEWATTQNYANASRAERLSEAGRSVCTAEWLPDRNDSSHAPKELCLDDLPDGFTRDESLAASIGMRPTSLAKAAEVAGVKVEDIEFLKEHEEEFEEFKRRVTAAAAGSDENEPGDASEYRKGLRDRYSRPAQTGEPDEGGEPGPVLDAEGRRQRTEDEISSRISEEPPRGQRYSKVSRKTWEAKDDRVRTFLREEYNGRCQICHDTFLKRNGEPYFEGLYIVPRRQASWLDHPGNVLCLCATCCAKFEHGPVESDENLLDQARGAEEVLRVRLCDSDTEIWFSERHWLEVQAMARQAGDSAEVPSETGEPHLLGDRPAQGEEKEGREPSLPSPFEPGTGSSQTASERLAEQVERTGGWAGAGQRALVSSSEHEESDAPRQDVKEPAAFIEHLRSLGLEVVDNRPTGGVLWVVGGENLGNLLEAHGFAFTPKGGKATGRRPAWYLPG